MVRALHSRISLITTTETLERNMAEFNPKWDIYNPSLAGSKANKPAAGYTTFGATGAPTGTATGTGGFQVRPLSAPAVGSPKSALDAAVTKIASGSSTMPTHLQELNQIGQGVRDRNAAIASQNAALQGLNDAMYETVGGPNAALIAQLNAQKAQYAQNYSQNKADVENLYGTLTEDITQYGADLQGRYDTTMGQMATDQSGYQQGLTDTLASQQANRAAAAAELGLGIESLQAPPSTAMNEIAAASGAAAENWKNLFSANKLFEQASTGRQVTGAENTKSNQLLAMKRYLDQQNMALDAQIAGEKSKTATQQLTDVGRKLRDAQIDQTLKYAQGLAPGIYGSPDVQQSDLMTRFETAQSNLLNLTGNQYSLAELTAMLDNIRAKAALSARENPSAETELTLEESILSNDLGFRSSDLG